MNRIFFIIPVLLFTACSNFNQIDVVYEMPKSLEINSSSQSSYFSQFSLIPSSVLIKVPFTVQAPHANWDDPYQEACEEASLIMVSSYLNNNELDTESSDKAIVDLISWETDNKYPQDVTINQLAEIAENYFGHKAEIINDPSIEDIKYQVSQGKPVIVPAAGRKLGNPYFSGEGPWYHMLVITGYKGNKFITNDPGTKRGEDYKYKFDVLMDAIHDWTGVKEEIEMGSRRILIVHLESEISSK